MVWIMFESSVNSEGIETGKRRRVAHTGFESSVNSEGIETFIKSIEGYKPFESSVNSEGIETFITDWRQTGCLRAV